MSDKQPEASHVEKAEGRLSRAVELAAGSMGEDREVPVALAEAQVHASLALADEIRQLREQMFPDPGEHHAEVWS